MIPMSSHIIIMLLSLLLSLLSLLLLATQVLLFSTQDYWYVNDEKWEADVVMTDELAEAVEQSVAAATDQENSDLAVAMNHHCFVSTRSCRRGPRCKHTRRSSACMCLARSTTLHAFAGPKVAWRAAGAWHCKSRRIMLRLPKAWAVRGVGDAGHAPAQAVVTGGRSPARGHLFCFGVLCFGVILFCFWRWP